MFGRDPKELELPALYGLMHRVYGHKTSYEIELEEGSDGAKQINAHLEKIFAYENAPYPIDINQIAFRGKGGSLSVGDLILVDAPKPMIFMCASVGYVQLSNKFVDAFKDMGPSIIVDENINDVGWAMLRDPNSAAYGLHLWLHAYPETVSQKRMNRCCFKKLYRIDASINVVFRRGSNC